MQVRQLIIIFLLLCSFPYVYAQGKDTINIIDNNGLKEGHWIVFGENMSSSCYQPKQKVSEGYYINDKKDGTWYEYYCDDKIKSIIEFKEGRPNGKCVTFHPNGAVNETGTWIINGWVGEYFLYYDTGKPQRIFNFNEKRQRDGFLKYYFRNGMLQVISKWIDNKDYASLQFDTLGKLIGTGLNGKALKEGDKISDEDKKIIDSMKEVAAKENKKATPTKEPPKKKETTKPNIQDVNFNRKEIQKSN
jgi:MORN repeat protein